MPDPHHVLTAAEAARYLRVSERSLIRWRNARKGPAWTYAGKQVRYRLADLDAYLAGRTCEPVAERGAA